MGVPPDDLLSADFGTSDPPGVGVGLGHLGRFFPRAGSTFAILSTGAASSAELPNTAGNLSTVQSFGALKNSDGQDMAQLTLVLQPPAGATCLAFDFAFYSEEFPEFVGSVFNDFFLAELSASTFTIGADFKVTAPNNFAFDSIGSLITINTVFGVAPHTLTTYDGATPILRAVTPVAQFNGGPVTVVLTVSDLGDPFFDSAVFLDNFAWLFEDGCGSGAGLASQVISPPSSFVSSGQHFDLQLFEAKPLVQPRLVRVNGNDLSAAVSAACLPGTLPAGGTTVRCPGLSRDLLVSQFGPGPYLVEVTLDFDDGTKVTESAIYLFPQDGLDDRAVLVVPPSGTYGLTQAFDLVLLLNGAFGVPTGGSASMNGVDVTDLLLACFVGAEALPQSVTALRCPISGALLGPGVHVFTVRVVFDGDPAKTATESVTWRVLANTEP